MIVFFAEFIVVDSYDYDPANDSSDVMETASQLCPSYKSTSDHQILVTSPIDSDRDHLMAVLRALCRIMAYRVRHYFFLHFSKKKSGVIVMTPLSVLAFTLVNL
jgi:hypothetical protein